MQVNSGKGWIRTTSMSFPLQFPEATCYQDPIVCCQSQDLPICFIQKIPNTFSMRAYHPFGPGLVELAELNYSFKW